MNNEKLYNVWMVYNHHGHHLPEPVKMTNYAMTHHECTVFNSKMMKPAHNMVIENGQEDKYFEN